MASISQDYWGDKKTLGDRSPPAGSRGGAPVGGQGDEVPQKLKLFVKLHIKFALKYNKQQLLPLLDKIILAAKYENSKISGDITMDVPPSELLGGHVPPDPYGSTPLVGI